MLRNHQQNLGLKKQITQMEKGNGRTRRLRYLILLTWNILSLYRAGACQTLTEMLSLYTVSIAALQEIR